MSNTNQYSLKWVLAWKLAGKTKTNKQTKDKGGRQACVGGVMNKPPPNQNACGANLVSVWHQKTHAFVVALWIYGIHKALTNQYIFAWIGV